MSGTNEISYELFKPFGPFIGDFTIPKGVVDKLNAFADGVAANPQRFKELDLGNHLAGEVAQEFKVPPEVLQGDVAQFLMNVTATYVQGATGKQITSFKLLNCWIVRSFAGDFNPPHNHRGHVSGAGYLMVPPQIGSEEGSRKHMRSSGFINFTHGVQQFGSQGHIALEPQQGHMFLFPHYLNHSVNPFTGPGERRSFSFNAQVDDQIFDVYS